MIFVTLGSQKFQFNRLLMEIDSLIEKGYINDEVFAQIGYSDYIPKNYNYVNFLDRDEFIRAEENAEIIITHGGTGSIIGAIKKQKKVIAVPRLAKYGEHVDNHQIQLLEQFKEQNLICSIMECNELAFALNFVSKNEFNSYESNTSNIIKSIDDYLVCIKGKKRKLFK